MDSQRVHTQQRENIDKAISGRKPVETKRESAKRSYRGSPFPGISSPSLSALQLTPRNILHLQRAIGNRAVGRIIQAKLQVGQPGDRYEQEADRVAETVMQMPEPQVHRQPEEEKEKLLQTKGLSGQISAFATSGILSRGIEEEDDEDKENVVAKELPGQTPKVTSGLEGQINSMKAGGQPLTESLRSFFEPRFGHDFNQVRVHTGGPANETAQTLNAKAYTVGHHIAFGSGHYSPDTESGKTLLAHELTHVIQQTTP